MKIYGKSDVGLVRENNQDFFHTHIFSSECAFAVVCDGMGGVNGGQLASKTAVEFVVKKIKNEKIDQMSDQQIKSLLKNLCSQANTQVYQMSQKDDSLKGMGTTIVFAIIRSNELHLVYAGDSRAYMISENNIRQITKDHSIVQQLVESGQITEEQAKNHPKKNMITRALGVYEKLELDYCQQDFQKNQAILICTDGLTNYLNNEKLLKIINESGDENSVKRFVEEAKKHGGGDNITAVLIRN